MARKKETDSKSEKDKGGFKSIPLKDIMSIGKETIKTAKTVGDLWCEQERTKQAEFDANAKIRASDNKLAEARLKRESEHERNFTAFWEAVAKAKNESNDIRMKGLIELVKTYRILVVQTEDPGFHAHCLSCLDKLTEYINDTGNEDVRTTATAWLESERRRLS